jgi:hypothetical protein
LRKSLILKGAGNRVRTDDLLITNQLLYQLSYAGFSYFCEKNHILAAAAKLCFQILNAAINNLPSERTSAEWDLIQGGFASEPPVLSAPGWVKVWSQEATSLKVASLPAS